MESKTKFVKDEKARSITVSRDFEAPVQEVWDAYTKRELLDLWWGPAPWKAETKSMDFKTGGSWLYAMVGPKGEKQWSKTNFKKIEPLKEIEADDGFCDEDGKMDESLPRTKWKCAFIETENGTHVDFKLDFASEEDMKMLLEMGFESGFDTGLRQLDELLAKEKVV